MITKVKPGTPEVVVDYLRAIEEWFIHAGPDTDPDVERVYGHQYHQAWKNLLDAGYIPTQTDAYLVL
jgi:hypothetical protein